MGPDPQRRGAHRRDRQPFGAGPAEAGRLSTDVGKIRGHDEVFGMAVCGRCQPSGFEEAAAARDCSNEFSIEPLAWCPPRRSLFPPALPLLAFTRFLCWLLAPPPHWRRLSGARRDLPRQECSRSGQLGRGLAPRRGCLCWAHKKKPDPEVRLWQFPDRRFLDYLNSIARVAEP